MPLVSQLAIIERKSVNEVGTKFSSRTAIGSTAFFLTVFLLFGLLLSSG